MSKMIEFSKKFAAKILLALFIKKLLDKKHWIDLYGNKR